jgi:hypothetical protein
MHFITTKNRFLSKLQLKKNKTFLLSAVFVISSLNVYSQTSSLINSCADFVAGPNATWPHVLVATTIDSTVVSQGSQTFNINVTSLPVSGANFRVYKTVANGNDYFGNPVALTLGSNSITVAAVTFDRAVKFQFSNGDVEFDALSLNGVPSSCVGTVPPSTSSLISSCGDFVTGPNATWPHVLVSTTIDSGVVSQGSQTFNINVTSLPVGGANFRVYKTVANGNDYFGNPVVLTLGSNSITVAAVTFDRAVKFQFSNGDVEFDALSLNGVESDCVANTTSTKMPEYYLFLNTFPNPSNGDLFIESNGPINSLEIKDFSGKVVFEMAPKKTKVHIQISQLKNSIYFLSCLIEKEWITKKIILNQR